MRRGRTYDWLPLWRRKWLMGSTRWELDPAERGVFVDFLCIAGDDDGFIRANPETPYPLPYLAGMLQVPLDVLERTVEKCLAVGKLQRDERGCLYICSWEQYQLTGRHKRRLLSETEKKTETETDTERETERESGHPDIMSGNADIKGNPSSSPHEKLGIDKDGLLPIPAGLPFTASDELKERRADVRRLAKMLNAGYKHDGPAQLTPEILEKRKKAFNERVRDYLP